MLSPGTLLCLCRRRAAIEKLLSAGTILTSRSSRQQGEPSWTVRVSQCQLSQFSAGEIQCWFEQNSSELWTLTAHWVPFLFRARHVELWNGRVPNAQKSSDGRNHVDTLYTSSGEFSGPPEPVVTIFWQPWPSRHALHTGCFIFLWEYLFCAKDFWNFIYIFFTKKLHKFGAKKSTT